jgi:hypothetical protein
MKHLLPLLVVLGLVATLQAQTIKKNIPYAGRRMMATLRSK